jgi:hypothetical protein
VDDLYGRLNHVKYQDGTLCVDGLRNEELVLLLSPNLQQSVRAVGAGLRVPIMPCCVAFVVTAV